MHLYEDYDFDLSTKYHDNNFYYNGNEFILPSSSTLDSNNANKMHLSDLISYPDPSAGFLSTSPMISPPSTGNTVNTQVDTRIFQFPPSNQVKQEDFMPCLQDGYSISPMAISPNMSTLNTPRGSITSMRSQQSPMDQNPPPPQTHHPQSNPGVDPIMSSYDAFEAAFVYPCSSQNYPSPPGSPIVSSTTNFQPYDDYFTIPQAQETVPNITFANQSSVLTTYTSTPDPTESFVSSDTCPETPDSSVKEEADTVNSPDTGSYICLWQDCAEEFVTQKTLVEHINENHMDNKKGCEEFPCMWKDCSRKSKAFNAKYKLITHMRVHTKEKPYLCMHEGCNRAFARSENRKIHMRSHSGEKPFNCKYAQEFNCTKKFSNSSDRAKHEQTHKDPKPYKCEVLGCTKRYTDPSSLRKHVKSHSAEEQEQYRRTKDLANLAKRSTSPTARYSSWTPGPATSSSLNHHQGPSVILEEQHLLTSSSTLLQTGGTLMTMEDMSSSSPVAPGVPSPLMQHKSREQSQRNESYPHHPHHQALAHQQNSLDDLDNDTIPFDNVPVRYDGTDLYNEMNTEWPSN